MESPRLSRFQSTASHLFARTRSFHRPTYKRPASTFQNSALKMADDKVRSKARLFGGNF